MTDTPYHNPGNHPPAEVNSNAWDMAARAKRIVRIRNRVAATGDIQGQAEEAVAVEELKATAEARAQAQYDRQALAEHTAVEYGHELTSDSDELAYRLRRLSDARPGTPEFYKQHRIQPPEPVMVSYSMGKDVPEGKARVMTRVWAVDCDVWIDRFGIENMPRLGKLAGEECTNEELRLLKQARYPVAWDKDGDPVGYKNACDLRDLPEIEEGVGAEVEIKHWSPEERAEAGRYPVTGYIPADTGEEGIPATEHVILPDDLGTAG